MKKVNDIVLTKERFGDQLWYQVGETLSTLLKAGYIAVVKEEEHGIVVIEYDYDDYLGYGNPTPYWLTENQITCISDDIELE